MKTPFIIFVVEDDPWFGEMLKHHLSLNPDHEVHLFNTARACLNHLHLKPDVVSIDFALPDLSGDQLLIKIHEVNRNIPVIVTSGQEDVSVAVNFFRAGAADYIVKDANTRELLWNAIIKIRENASLKMEVEDLKEQLGQKYSFSKTVIGQSPALKKVLQLVEKAVKTNINVSVTGETGTGKEIIARAIHFNSERKRKPFVAVNMAAIPAELIESELFGYEKGAFTGAHSRRTGKFEEAEGGTLFLDEIAELDLALQSKILRALQEREVVRLGSNQPVKFNARIITATHKNLQEEVTAGKFREDLYYRIIGLPIELPPLRERGNDILVLAKHFISAYSKDNGAPAISITEEAQKKLMSYHYPGNIRELKAVVELACVMCNDNVIVPGDITFNALRPGRAYIEGEKTLREYTGEIISGYLKKYDNNVVLVAKKLDIGKSTIYNMIQKKEIEVE